MTDHTHRHARHRYFTDLDRLPIGQTTTATGLDEHGLPVLATTDVADRTIRFALVIGQPRLRLTFTDQDPALLGHVTGLDRDRPRLIVSEPLHLSWGFTHAEPIEHHAQRLWSAALRHCDR
jgi:hypothetical protein